jgi:hypothetical protein
MDVKASITNELDEKLVPGEASCAVERRWSQCTWDRLWKRRFRVFNSGSESTHIPRVVQYGDAIVDNSMLYVPQP